MIVDDGPGDDDATNAGILKVTGDIQGLINQIAPGALPDFTVSGYQVTASATPAGAIATQNGTISRTSTTGGAKAVRVTVRATVDRSLDSPLPEQLRATAVPTFTDFDTTAFDEFATYQATFDALGGAGPQSEPSPPFHFQPPPAASGSYTPPPSNLGPVPIAGTLPYTIGNTYTAFLGANTGPNAKVQTNGQTLVTGATLQPAAVGDLVFEDANANGLQDTGEPGIPGVAVSLKDTNGSVVASTTTDANGNYLFTGLTPGTYVVGFAAPGGYAFTAPNVGSDDAIDSDALPAMNGMTGAIDLTSGETNRTVDAGLYRPATIGDLVFEDVNGNGLQDQGEPGIPGVTVNLKDAGGNVLATTTTGPNGKYTFTDLTPGTYVVGFVAPNGYAFTAPNVGGDDAIDSDALPAMNGMTAPVSLTSGQTDATIDAGLYRPAAIGDFVFDDLNGNGLQDQGEPGIPGVAVSLKDTNGSVATTTTDANGNYLFTGLLPGTYSVGFAAPAGYEFTAPNVGTDDAIDSNALPATGGMTGPITLASGETNRTIDAGLYRPAALGDLVFEDANANGLQDTGEPGIPGVAVSLKDTNGSVVATTTTDANGNYLFTGLTPGTYVVGFAAPGGYAFTAPNVGSDDAIDSDALPAMGGMTMPIDLTSGETDRTVDAGLYRPATIGDLVFEDVNGNGLQDQGEPGIPGVTVNLKDAGGNVLATTTTGPNGNYTFTGLTPGTYVVGFVAPNGYAFTAPNVGGDDAIDSDALPAMNGMTAPVTLTSGQTDATIDAGLYRPVAIGDLVFRDTNGNGLQDQGEPGLAGITVRVEDTAGVVVATTMTGPDGKYLVDALAPGTYVVAFDVPPAFVFTMPNVGGDDAIDSDALPAMNGMTAPITLTSGQTNLTIDAGVVQNGAIGDFVFEDVNGNGLQDTGEPGLPGVVVDLKDADGNVLMTTTTGPDGHYMFQALGPGTYMVGFHTFAGFRFTAPNVGSDDAIDSDALPATGGLTNPIALAAGEVDRTVDAGLYWAGGIGDLVFRDTNGNGLQDTGEPGVPGATVKLLDASGNVLATTTTDAGGHYQFLGLAPGSYRVGFVAPDGVGFTAPNVGSDDAIDSDAQPASGQSGLVTIVSGLYNPTIDAGLFAAVSPESLGSLSGLVFADIHDTNGVFDANDLPIANVLIRLRKVDATGTPALVGQTLTSVDGTYRFDNLPAGTYMIDEVQPYAFNDGKDNVGTLGGVAFNDVLAAIPLNPGDAGTGYTFAERLTPSCRPTVSNLLAAAAIGRPATNVSTPVLLYFPYLVADGIGAIPPAIATAIDLQSLVATGRPVERIGPVPSVTRSFLA